ncbi:hypothetical protein EGR_09903 [Echinococcus granulosus]|uniref:Uncharacterized protein n=1 Tax=Echinococcus granulosus TaxID=6210 RepID=W6U2A6_ECHGR|nr:hypothetical protein EGR_09903 [Echinococcus granulosus]EUB55240.1 hypothetical protein EGR_09903 [Echinococcus granulosus]
MKNNDKSRLEGYAPKTEAQAVPVFLPLAMQTREGLFILLCPQCGSHTDGYFRCSRTAQRDRRRCGGMAPQMVGGCASALQYTTLAASWYLPSTMRY